MLLFFTLLAAFVLVDSQLCSEYAKEVEVDGACVKCEQHIVDLKCVPCPLNAVEVDGACVACPKNQVNVGGECTCLSYTVIGECLPCLGYVVDGRCQSCGRNMEERYGICVCGSNAVPDPDRRNCYYCQPNQVVVGEECVCPTEVLPSGGCAPCLGHFVDGLCQTCPRNKLEDDNGECVCPTNEFLQDGECRPCTGGRVVERVCTCAGHYVYYGGECVCPRNILGSCVGCNEYDPYVVKGKCERCPRNEVYQPGRNSGCVCVANMRRVDGQCVPYSCPGNEVEERGECVCVTNEVRDGNGTGACVCPTAVVAGKCARCRGRVLDAKCGPCDPKELWLASSGQCTPCDAVPGAGLVRGKCTACTTVVVGGQCVACKGTFRRSDGTCCDGTFVNGQCWPCSGAVVRGECVPCSGVVAADGRSCLPCPTKVVRGECVPCSGVVVGGKCCELTLESLAQACRCIAAEDGTQDDVSSNCPQPSNDDPGICINLRRATARLLCNKLK